MLDISFLGAALAGLLSFFTPCVLPMVPFYLCYMAGISMQELRDDEGLPEGAQSRLVLSSVFFALGVTTIFVLLGMGATAVGQTFGQWRETLSYVAAAVLMLFGLHFLGIMRIPLLYREAKIESS
ncbi:MAG: cytochrome c-type biogenesis protein, partial [Yoonia sp.]